MSNLQRITRGVQPSAFYNCIMGSHGVGKTAVAAAFPDPIFISFDSGDSELDIARFVPDDWDDAMTTLAELHEENGAGFKTVNIDSLSFAEDFCRTYVAAQNDVENIEDIKFKWKGLLYDEFQVMIDWCEALHAQGLHINFLGHTHIEKYRDPLGADYDKFVLQLKTQDLANRVLRGCSNVFFLDFDFKAEKVERAGQKKTIGAGAARRFIHTEQRPAYDAKNRFDLPPRIEYTKSPEEGIAKLFEAYDAWLAEKVPAKKPVKKSRSTKTQSTEEA